MPQTERRTDGTEGSVRHITDEDLLLLVMLVGVVLAGIVHVLMG